MTEALICIDWIDEIVGADGKLAAKGYRSFIDANGTLDRLAMRQNRARQDGHPVVHVHLGFDHCYGDHPKSSPLLAGARDAGILQIDTPSTTIATEVAPSVGDIVIVKKRISPFYGTSLALTLRSLGISDLVIAGVATDIAVQSAARDAHDRDFRVLVAADCCAAATQSDHEQALANISKFATVV